MGTYKEGFEKYIRKTRNGLIPKEVLSFLDSLERLNSLFFILRDDFRTAQNMLKEQPHNQYLQRTFVRTAFATFEGLLNILLQTILKAHENDFIDLTEDEEKKFKQRGMARKVKFSVELYAQKMGGISYFLDTASDEWEKFTDAISIRNRLIHPNDLNAIKLNEKQLVTVLEATNWFIDLYQDLSNQVAEVSSPYRSLEKSIRELIRELQSDK